MAFLEAWSSGKPIIVTRHAPEIAKLVQKNGGGFVVPDDSRELAKAIIKLLSDKELRSSMGKVGRQIALTEYPWEKTFSDTYKRYLALLRRRD